MRSAIAMIELIFAIVILGIVMMSAPLLIATATQSSYVVLQQEAIATASAKIAMILTHHWDEGNTDPTRTASILVSPKGNSDLKQMMNGTIPTGRRAGTPESSSRRFFHSLGGEAISTTPHAKLGPDNGDRDDIDDFITKKPKNALIDLGSTSTEIGDVIDKKMMIEVKANYLDDRPNSGTYRGSTTKIAYHLPFKRVIKTDSNIKQVQVKLTTNHTEKELQKEIVLNAFSCNIGTYQLREAVFK